MVSSVTDWKEKPAFWMLVGLEVPIANPNLTKKGCLRSPTLHPTQHSTAMGRAYVGYLKKKFSPSWSGCSLVGLALDIGETLT